MEADGASSGTCDHCRRVGHRVDQCDELASDKRLDRALGVVAGILLSPLVGAGWLLGTFIGAFWAGLKCGFLSWPYWRGLMYKLFGIEPR